MQNRLNILFNTLFLLAVFLLVYIVLGPHLLFHHQQAGFSWDITTIREFLNHPAGLVEYFSLFLFQLSKVPIFGALTYALLMLCIVLSASNLLASDNSKANQILKFTPVLILGLQLSNFSFSLFYPVLLLVLLLLLLFYKCFSAKITSGSAFVWTMVFLMPLSYYVLGGLVFFVFVVSFLLYDAFKGQKHSLLSYLFIILYSLAVPLFSARYFFNITIDDAFFKLIPYFDRTPRGIVLYLTFISVPFIIMCQYILTILFSKWRGIKALQIIQFALVLSAFVFVFLNNTDFNNKHKIHVNYLAYNWNWEGVLEKAENHGSTDRAVSFQVNRALYHTGQLHEKMFDHPQIWGVDGLILNRYIMSDVLLPTTDLFMDMGYMNEAIHWANEAISQYENSPQLITRLIQLHIIDGNYKSAMLYIELLKKYPFFRKGALRYEAMVDNDSPDEWMLRLRKNIPERNFRTNRMSPDNDFINLLEENPDNKIVYEYLMAYYMLNNDLASVFKYFQLGESMGYEKTPRLYQEALASYMYELNRRDMPVPDIKIDNDVLSDFSDYIGNLMEFDGNLKAARQFQKQKSSNTYWYYLHYESPVSQNRRIIVE